MKPLPSRRAFVEILVVVAVVAGLSFASAASAADGETTAGPRPEERGLPLLRTVEPDLPEFNNQNFGVASDPKNGLLWVANGNGILTFDGAFWRRVPIGEFETAFTVAVDSQGRVAAGGFDEFGLIERDAVGQLVYRSLSNLLPPERRKLSQSLSITPTPEGFLFLNDQALWSWDGAGIKQIAAFPPGPPFPEIFKSDQQTYIWWGEGLHRIVGEQIQKIPGGDRFRGRRIDGLAVEADGLLVSVRGEGLFRFREGALVPFSPEGSEWAKKSRVLEAISLPRGGWALASLVGGILLLDEDGSINRVVDTHVGLPDNFAYSMAVDHEGGLWAALNTALVRIEVESTLSLIDRRLGLEGTALGLLRHDGALWVATAAGLFTNRESAPRFHRVEELPPSGWSLASIDGDLLAGMAYGTFRLRTGAPPRQIEGTEGFTTFTLVRSGKNRERVWAGTTNGLAEFVREAGEWKLEGEEIDLGAEIRSLVESTDRLWLHGNGTSAFGLALDPATGRVKKPLERTEIPSVLSSALTRLDGQIVSIIDGKLHRLDEQSARWVPDSGRTLPQGAKGNFTEDANGDLWIAATPPSVVSTSRATKKDGPLAFHLVDVPSRTIDTLYAESDGVVWLAGDLGLARYTQGVSGLARGDLLAPSLARVTTTPDGILFEGEPGRATPSSELPTDVRKIRVDFAPRSFRTGLRYSIRLDPIDLEWSTPSTTPFIELTRPPPGRYTLHVRTIDRNDTHSPEAVWSFHVATPWYARPWALALWLGAALLLVRAYGGFRARADRRLARALETQVAEKTVELSAAVADLERTQGDLLSANARLSELSLQDELTGIANRRRLQTALEAEWSRAFRLQTPIAFLMLDLDHFKQLNDSHGHIEGDRCLVAVAKAITKNIHRPGDLAARYGGEEFAILLPGTDLAGAVAIAETLRQSIEGLGFSSGGPRPGRLTVSVGIAVRIPLADEQPESLLQAADSALYHAKSAGRNQVAIAAA